MKSIEKILYKIIVDLISTLTKYNINTTSVNVKLKPYYNTKTVQTHITDMSILYSTYNTLNNDKTIDCQFGNIIFIDTMNLNSNINNLNVSYIANNLIDNTSLNIKNNKYLSSLDQTYVNNQESKISQLITNYKKMYSYINTYKDTIVEEFYSPCYATPGWTVDYLSDNKLSTINKYNLYEIDLKTLTNYEEVRIIKNILNI